MNIKYVLVAMGLAVLAASGSCLGAGSDPDPRFLDQEISEYLQKFDPSPGSGLAIAIIQDGKVVFEKGYGYRDRAQKLPVTSKTVFEIGSTTKAFTATALAMLQEEGKVDFQSPMRKYLPDFTLSNEVASSSATLVDLLSHRTGLPRHDLIAYETPFSSQDIYQRLRYLSYPTDPSIGFRTTWQYNNLMYMVAGELLGKLEGKSWEQAVRDRLVDPLGMKDTRFSWDEESQVTDRALPYIFDRPLTVPQGITATAPACAIKSNLLDMEKWLSFYLRQGLDASGRRLISVRALQTLEAPVISAEMAIAPGQSYGMGWFVGSIEGERLIWHGGNTDGYSAHVSFMPERKLALVILTNQTLDGIFQDPYVVPASGSRPAVHLLPWLIYHSILHPEAPIHDAPLAKGSPAKAPLIPTVSLNPSDYVGTFRNPGYGDLKIVQSGNQLAITYYSLNGTLLPLDPDHFSADFKISAHPDKSVFPIGISRRDGKVVGLSSPLEPTAPPIYFERQ